MTQLGHSAFSRFLSRHGISADIAVFINDWRRPPDGKNSVIGYSGFQGIVRSAASSGRCRGNKCQRVHTTVVSLA